MTILIVEDELLIAEMLKEMLFDLGYINVFITKNFKQAQQQLVLNKNIDLAFLDINLTDIKSGIDVANYINKELKIPFIYLTSYSDPKSVKEATATLPDAYLLKPFKKRELFSTLEMVKAREQINANAYTTIKEGNNSVRIPLNELLFVKSEKNYLDVFTTTKRYVTRQSIESFIQDLDSIKFKRVHRSFAVNIDKVEEVSGYEIKLKEHTIPLSRNYKKEILTSLT